MRKMKKVNSKKVLACILTVASLFGCMGTVFATGGNAALNVVNNLSTFIFGIIRAIGMILLGFGIVQLGLSLKSHDAAQRANRIYDISRWYNYYFC